MDKWFIGLCFALILGHVITASFLCVLRKHLHQRKGEEWFYILTSCFGITYYPPVIERSHSPVIHPAIVGLMERLFFTILISQKIGGAGIAMIAWIGIRAVASRDSRDPETTGQKYINIDLAFVLGNLLSMLFALIGGLLIRDWNIILSWLRV